MDTYIYIDGFNLYYRALKNSPYKWLDLRILCEKLLNANNHIVKIKYFTAMVSGMIDSRQPIRQKTYIRALQKYIPELEVYYGHFMTHEVSAPRAPLSKPPKFTKVVKTEEKGSDVNLAVHLINDYWLKKYKCAVILSNDSDLAEPLRLIKKRNDSVIGLICPFDKSKGHPSRELAKYANFIKRIRGGVLQDSQLPNPIPGSTISKPNGW